MKRIALIVASILLITSLSVCFAACGGDGDESGAASTTSGTASAEESDNSVDSKPEDSKPEDSEPEVSEPEQLVAEQKYEIDRTLTATSVTEGKTYEAPANTRNDGYDDDGVKLTDGNVGPDDGGSTEYTGISMTGSCEVVIDLGEVVTGIADFKTYIAGGGWGISFPGSVTYYVSNDKENWYLVDEVLTTDIEPIYEGEVNGDDQWKKYDYALELEKGVEGQYIKVVIAGANWFWCSEIVANTYVAAE